MHTKLDWSKEISPLTGDVELWSCVVWSVSALVSEEWLSNVIQAAAWLGCILFLNANAMYKQGFTSL